MQWYSNLKIGTKLLVAFSLIAFIAGIIGVVGIVDIQKIKKADEDMYKQTIAVELIGKISTNFQRLRVNLRDLVSASTQEEINHYVKRVQELRDVVVESSAKYEKTLATEADKKLFKEFQDVWGAFAPLQEKIVALAAANRDAEANALMKGDAKKAAGTIIDLIEKIVIDEVKAADELAKGNSSTANSAIATTIALTIGGVLIAFVLGIIIAGIISRPVKELAAQAKTHGSLIVGQVSHPGRQVENRIQKNPISASDVQLEGKHSWTNHQGL